MIITSNFPVFHLTCINSYIILISRKKISLERNAKNNSNLYLTVKEELQ